MTPWIVLATIVGYFILLFIISWAASRKSDTATALSGGRQAPWFIVAIAMLGAPISGVTFISVPGMVVTKGFSYLQMALGFIVGYFVIAYVLIPLFYKRNLVSIYGYLEQRFGGSTHKSGAWFFFISKMLGAAAHPLCHQRHRDYRADFPVHAAGRCKDSHLDRHVEELLPHPVGGVEHLFCRQGPGL